MNINIVIEPEYAHSLWCTQYMNGIRSELDRMRDTANLLYSNNLPSSIESYSSPKGRPLAMIIGTSVSWVPQTIAKLSQLGVHCVLLAYSASLFQGNVSSVTMDYQQAIRSLIGYLEHHGQSKIALFGINPDSANDWQKQEAFAHIRKTTGHTNPDDNVFFNFARLDRTCQVFFRSLDQYQAVICANDIAAILLVRFLIQKGVRIPEDLYVTSIGDSKIARIIKPTITAARLDFAEAGRQAVQMYATLSKSPSLSSLTATLNCLVHVGESTALKPAKHISTAWRFIHDSTRPINFYSDDEVLDILKIENLLNQCDDIDISILHGIADQQVYIDLADALHVSENTIKYRVKKMMRITDLDTREGLMKLLSQYLRL